MSYYAEEITLSTMEVPLPWLVDEDLPTSSIDPSGTTLNAPQTSSAERSPLTPPDSRAEVSHESWPATPHQWPTMSTPAHTPPQQQDIPQFQPTAQRTNTMAILAPVCFGLLALVIVLMILASVGHGAAFSGAHGLHGVAQLI
jgi:hypothetical protein